MRHTTATQETTKEAIANEVEDSVSLDFEALSKNATQFVEKAAQATSAYLRPLQEGRATPLAEEVGEVVRTLGNIAEKWMVDPHKSLEAQQSLTSDFLELWGRTLHRMQGEDVSPVVKPDAKDTRFAGEEWQNNPVFDFIKQAYLITTRWAEGMVEGAEGVDDHTRLKARFYVKQISSALAPSNFLATNPELIRQTMDENGANLVRGMGMLAEDIQLGDGQLKIRQSDPTKFEVGVNLANTPGKVVFRNDVIELIQYTPTTAAVLKRPLLVIPPWINKYYILDLNPEKSFIRWAVEQGQTVFCISWVNPDESHSKKSFEDYMREGIFAALDSITLATGERNVAAIGYCVGGTLLSIALAYMALTGDRRITSATFFTTQVDFTNAGDLKVFVDESQILALEHRMKEKGYLDGSKMANAFNMLRPNDLIWPYIVNVYMKGEAPFPFDLLYWNSDSTRMPAANHSFYMRKCYLENQLAKGEMSIGNVKIDLKNITLPIYSLAAKEDHIAPAKSVFDGCKMFGGPVTYVLAGSGHIAGVVNSPRKPKYQYLTGGVVSGEYEDWQKDTNETQGSWWPHWQLWLEAQAPERVPARQPGSGLLSPLCDAPGTYVRVK
jgi:polyhydroxyalkanoate synthase subunit PhaC